MLKTLVESHRYVWLRENTKDWRNRILRFRDKTRKFLNGSTFWSWKHANFAHFETEIAQNNEMILRFCGLRLLPRALLFFFYEKNKDKDRKYKKETATSLKLQKNQWNNALRFEALLSTASIYLWLYCQCVSVSTGILTWNRKGKEKHRQTGKLKKWRKC